MKLNYEKIENQLLRLISGNGLEIGAFMRWLKNEYVGEPGVSSECNTSLASGGDEGKGGPQNVGGDFARLILHHYENYNHIFKTTKDKDSEFMAFVAAKTLSDLLESAKKSNLVGDHFVCG